MARWGRVLLPLILISVTSIWAQVPSPSPSLADAALNLPPVPTKLKAIIMDDKQQQLTAGDVIELTAELPEQHQGAEPSMAANLVSEPVVWGDGRILWYKKINDRTLVFGLTSYKPGVFKISPIPLLKNGNPVVATEPKEIEFQALEKEEKEPDVYPPQKAALPLRLILAISCLGLLLLAALIYGLYKLAQKRRSGGAMVPLLKPLLPPFEEFEEAVRRLQAPALIEKGQFKPLYFGVSDGAKRFLGRAFRFNAEDKTTRELTQDLAQRIPSEPIVAQWRELFDEMDLVKFTDQSPNHAEAGSLAPRVLSLARKTFLLSPEGRIQTDEPKATS